MVIVKLMGGLGNQMFQYATGRVLAERHSTSLKIDLSFLNDRSLKENFTYRNFELHCFQNTFNVANNEDLNVFNPKSKLQRIRMKLRGKEIPVRYCEQKMNYDDNFTNLPSSTFLEGYFQTEKYFQSIRSILLQEFKWNPTADSVNQHIIKIIKITNSVAVHIRRGDYVMNKIINSYHGVCDISYYKTAIQKMNDLIENPTFFMFSDDINWVKKEFADTPSLQFIDHNTGSNSHLDMLLMSTCKHNIIANSSFSWWGAWLNNSPNKIVLAPKTWFSDNLRNDQTLDLIPAKWIRV